MDVKWLRLTEVPPYVAAITHRHAGDVGTSDGELSRKYSLLPSYIQAATPTILIQNQIHSLRVVVYPASEISSSAGGWSGRVRIFSGSWRLSGGVGEAITTGRGATQNLFIEEKNFEFSQVENLSQFAQGIEADGVISDLPSAIPAITVADCHPLFVFSEDHHQVQAIRGMLHSGWQGCGILAVASLAIQRIWGIPFSRISVYSGPGICSRCYPVTEERAALFSDRFGEESIGRASGTGAFQGKTMPSLDILRANALIAEKFGLNWLGESQLCPPEEPKLWSLRRDGQEECGRMLAAWLPI